MRDLRQPDGDRHRERPAVQLGPRGRGPAARDPGAAVAPQPDPGRSRASARRSSPRPTSSSATTRSASTASTTSRRPCEPIAFQGEFVGHRHAVVRPRCGCAIGEGLTGWVAAPQRARSAWATPRPTRAAASVGRRRRPGVDAPRADDLRGTRPGRHRRSRKAGYDQFDEDDERTLEIFAGYAAQALVNAEALRPAPPPAAGARAPAREPAPPARGQRAAARRPSTRPASSR